MPLRHALTLCLVAVLAAAAGLAAPTHAAAECETRVVSASDFSNPQSYVNATGALAVALDPDYVIMAGAPGSVVALTNVPGVALYTLTEQGYSWEFHSTAGPIRDSGSVTIP